MRTTLDIDPDVLQAAKELAEHRGTTAGRIISELARKALQPKSHGSLRNGVPVLPRRRSASSPKPTLKLVNQLRDEP